MENVDIQVLMDKLFQFLLPLSEQYGSGEVYADLMLVVFAASVLLLLVLLVFSPGSKENEGFYQGPIDGPSVDTIMNGLKAEVKQTLASNRSEVEFIKHELLLVREQMSELTELLRDRSAPKGRGDFGSPRMEINSKTGFVR